tara:strand:+ start:193 stop:387 length:195 start_codon:yes stop_codon:yes gene_type:complete
MIEAVAAAALLSCADGAWIIEGLGKAQSMTSREKYEVYREIRAVMPDNCDLSQFDFQRGVDNKR